MSVSRIKVKFVIKCFCENLAVNYLTFTAFRSAGKFSKEHIFAKIFLPYQEISDAQSKKRSLRGG